MNWLELVAVGFISALIYVIFTGLFGAVVSDSVNDSDAFPCFPWGAWVLGALIFVIVVLAWKH